MILVVLVCFFVLVSGEPDRDAFLYGKFPKGFLFGASTAAFQIEGGWNADGKGESIYDLMTHQMPQLFKYQNADVADDSYHKYKEDVKILKNYGAKAYRFSISWSRVLPNGTADKINKPGIDYYNKLLDELKANNIEPLVTLYHWDLPAGFRDIGGWLNESMVGYFNDFAKVCFKSFGSKVKKWLTINEPLVIMERHPFYMKGIISNKTELSILQYRTMHNLILGHATAYRTYEKDFKASQGGQVSLALSSGWGEPKTTNKQDIDAAERYMDFNLGIFAHPIYVDGDYPAVVKEYVAKKSAAGGIPNRFPSFTAEQKEMVKGSADFFGVNHYDSFLIQYHDFSAGNATPQEFRKDGDFNTSSDSSWEVTGVYHFRVVPWGMRRLLAFIKNNYKNPAVYVTENGCMVPGEYTMTLEQRLNDDFRISFYRRYINEALKANIKDGVNLKGYMAWTLMDNFEWGEGYHATFGLHYVNFSDPERTRVPKKSVSFFKTLIEDNGFVPPGSPSGGVAVKSPGLGFAVGCLFAAVLALKHVA